MQPNMLLHALFQSLQLAAGGEDIIL